MTGDSGCGKTSLIKAINGLWPYGRGNVDFPDGIKTFYAAQDVKLPQRFAEGTGLPAVPARRIFGRAGRGGTAQMRASAISSSIWQTTPAREKPGIWFFQAARSRSWSSPASSCSSPGLLFLDEAAGALDPQAKIAFHQAIKDHCPRITVISIMHEAVPPKSATGAEFYDSVLSDRRWRGDEEAAGRQSAGRADHHPGTGAAARPPAPAAHPPQGKIAARNRQRSASGGLAPAAAIGGADQDLVAGLDNQAADEGIGFALAAAA